jgi:hypothetical protein
MDRSPMARDKVVYENAAGTVKPALKTGAEPKPGGGFAGPGLDGGMPLPHCPAHERPFPHFRHLPGDYSLANFAGCGRLLLNE